MQNVLALPLSNSSTVQGAPPRLNSALVFIIDGEASKFSSSDSSDDGTRSGGDGTRSGGDGTRSGGDGSRKRSSSRSHEVRSRNVGTPGRSAPGPMRHPPLKAPRWLLLREQELLSLLSSVVLA
jgi:hypothetical protein